jgi:MoxR-like ATPase
MIYTAEDIKILTEKIEAETGFLQNIKSEIGKQIFGQKEMIDKLLIGLLCNGHILLEGVPGLAKTLSIRTLAQSISAKFSRIQFTPDLLPADVIGSMIYNQQQNQFFVRKGPIFANLILADEINRAPAKVQSALLEAMQERQVTIGDHSYPLEEPFLVLATQNPIDQEGTYSLPEAQVDRFLLKVIVQYPTMEEEKQIIRSQTNNQESMPVQAVASTADILRARNLVRAVYMDEKIESYIIQIVFATRIPENYGLQKFKPLISYGASPRAGIGMAIAAKAYALLQGRGFVIPDDVKMIAKDVLRHRIGLSYEAEAEEMDVEKIINAILAIIH